MTNNKTLKAEEIKFEKYKQFYKIQERIGFEKTFECALEFSSLQSKAKDDKIEELERENKELTKQNKEWKENFNTSIELWNEERNKLNSELSKQKEEIAQNNDNLDGYEVFTERQRLKILATQQTLKARELEIEALKKEKEHFRSLYLELSVDFQSKNNRIKELEEGLEDAHAVLISQIETFSGSDLDTRIDKILKPETTETPVSTPTEEGREG